MSSHRQGALLGWFDQFVPAYGQATLIDSCVCCGLAPIVVGVFDSALLLNLASTDYQDQNSSADHTIAASLIFHVSSSKLLYFTLAYAHVAIFRAILADRSFEVNISTNESI